MQFNLDRFRTFPELFKFITLLATIVLCLCLAAAKDQPSGTTFVWITAVLAIVVDSMFIMAVGLELEQTLFTQHSFLNWPLLECIFSSLFSINFFISIWLCVNSKSFSDTPTAYAISATLCLALFVLHVFRVFAYTRIWMAEQRKAMQVIDPQGISHPSYGGP